MKKFLIMITLLIMTKEIYSQTCAIMVVDSVSCTIPFEYGVSENLIGYIPAQQRSIGLSFHISRNSNNEPYVSENDISICIQRLNNAFSQGKIFFFLKSIDYLTGSSFINDEIRRDNLFTQNRDNSALNIYVVFNLGGFLNGVVESIPGNALALVQDRFLFDNSSTIIHEAGHCLALFHTYEKIFGFEKITRDYSAPCKANYNEKGDFLGDTPADNFNWNMDRDSCENENFQPDRSNYMFSSTGARNKFSLQQYGRMNFYLNTKLKYLLKTNVSFSNIHLENNIGGTIRVNDTTLISGNNAALFDGQNVLAETMDQIINNLKHLNWNKSGLTYKIKNSFNVNRLVESSLTQKSFFESVYPATIDLELLEGVSSTNTNSISLFDPWYVSNSDNLQEGQYLSYNPPFVPKSNYLNSLNGVFLDQGGPNLTTPPYYSVRVQQTQSVGGYTGNFINWSATGATFQNANALETPVRFDASGAVVKAIYKGHRLSSLANASGGTGICTPPNLGG